MKPIFEIFVPKPPVPKARPRMTRSGHAYTPKATSNYEAYLAAAVGQQWRTEPVEGPLHLDLAVCLPVPASWAAWKRAAALDRLVLPTTKPDWENSAKILDALNKLVWTDDCEIVSVKLKQIYARRPGLWIRLFKLPALRAQSARKADLEKL